MNVIAMSQVRQKRRLNYPLPHPLQYDMTAWVKRGTREEVGVIVDYTDST